jgi:hypothetical protein
MQTDLTLRLPVVLVSAFLLAATLAAPAHAQQPSSSDASWLDAGDAAPPATEVLVLGTPHLSGVSDRFAPSMVDRLVAALDAFGPDAVAIEGLPGRTVAAMDTWGGDFDRVAAQFAGSHRQYGRYVQSQMGWSWTEANRQADSLLAVVQSGDTAAASGTRLALVQSLIAAYRLPTAALQWRYLSDDVRAAQTVLPDTVASALDARQAMANETYSIGLRLAHQRGHQRLYPIDDHGDKDLLLDILPPLQQALTDSLRAAVQNAPYAQRRDSLLQAGLAAGNLLATYRFMNADDYARADVDAQWRGFLRDPFPDRLGQTRLALWEVRNLNMVGHIRRVAAQEPSGRVLVIVGASHKPFFDAYLRAMMNVRVVDAEQVLHRAP